MTRQFQGNFSRIFFESNLVVAIASYNNYDLLNPRKAFGFFLVIRIVLLSIVLLSILLPLVWTDVAVSFRLRRETLMSEWRSILLSALTVALTSTLMLFLTVIHIAGRIRYHHRQLGTPNALPISHIV